MAGIKELKTRIRSIGSTRKITRAMQMVSAAKMRKAQNAVVNSRSYASLAWEMMEGLGGNPLPNPPHKVEGTKRIGIILLTSNKGLVGSLNTNLITKLREVDPSTPSSTSSESAQDDNFANKELICEIITYGKKGQIIAARLKKDIVADFPKFDRTISIEDIYPIAKFVSDAYNTGKYEKIVIIYNHFVSTLSQKATVRQLLPFVSQTTNLQTTFESTNDYESELTPNTDNLTPIFEPTPQAVIDHLIPRIIESQIYQTILESDASEHSARMVMMKNATEAAGDLISDLTLTYNQLRQNKITTELAEITAGKIALE